MARRCRQLEDTFLKRLIASPQDLEILANNCTDIWTWHLHMESDKRFEYPAHWYVEQPNRDDLVLIENTDASLWPFIINKTRYGIRGRGERGEPFLYS